MVAAGVIEVYLREQSMACDVCQYLHYINFSWQETNETLILQSLMNHPFCMKLDFTGSRTVWEPCGGGTSHWSNSLDSRFHTQYKDIDSDTFLWHLPYMSNLRLYWFETWKALQTLQLDYRVLLCVCVALKIIFIVLFSNIWCLLGASYSEDFLYLSSPNGSPNITSNQTLR